jgi:hypothetical protein
MPQLRGNEPKLGLNIVVLYLIILSIMEIMRVTE